MVYSVLFVQKSPRLDCRISRLFDRYKPMFDVTVVPPESPIPEDRYTTADAVVAHASIGRSSELQGLCKRHPDVSLLIIPVGFIGKIHQELTEDADHAYILNRGFTEQDFIDSITRLSERRRSSLQSPVY